MVIDFGGREVPGSNLIKPKQFSTSLLFEADDKDLTVCSDQSNTYLVLHPILGKTRMLFEIFLSHKLLY